MRIIVHLSDLHFGRVHKATMQPLVRQINALKPHLVVVSGDLTQRARTAQFVEARRFLESLPKPQIVVPGNHDVPAYNLYKRFVEPLKKYRQHITEDLLPTYVDKETAVFGLNSSRSFTTKYGKLRERDVAQVCEKLTQLSTKVTKIVVCHHPFDLPPKHGKRDLIRRARSAMRAFAECEVDIILSGHLHQSHTSHTAERYRIPGHSALIVQAGTAISNRYRGGALNSFNVLRLEHTKLVVQRFEWDVKSLCYTLAKAEEFTRSSEGWSPAKAASAKSEANVQRRD
ncbi:MAG TPA: metallophosphoesterase family protein [Candidatus Dormibacteraeota bacterium]|nr:metallophosphoesterase family protein [Candidatus Dormibacteraeota bacterium]